MQIPFDIACIAVLASIIVSVIIIVRGTIKKVNARGGFFVETQSKSYPNKTYKN